MSNAVPEFKPQAGALRERVILVTGAGDGIGKAVALALAEYGAQLILLGRTQSKLEQVYDQITAAGQPQPAICPLDLARAEWPEFMAVGEGIAQDFGRLDGLLHNAAILGDRSAIEHHSISGWEQTLRVNLSAPFMLTRACLPLLKQSPDASVVFTSSGVGHRGRAYWGAYAVSKAGLENLTETLADETEANTHIRVNSINPGPVRTAMRAQAFPAEDRDKLVSAEDISNAYLYLLGPASRDVSGQHFDIQ